MSRRALIALGIGQCVNWGVLYYAATFALIAFLCAASTGTTDASGISQEVA